MYRIFVTLLLTAAAFGQWPTSPDSNLVICDRTGEQTLPKVRATPDDGCYVSWYDHSSGNYDMYLQRLDRNGVPQWPANGILVSNHPQESWITDYDLAADIDGSAIVVFNDIRAGGDWDIYAYLIGPGGQFMWGADGFALSNNNGFEPSPRVCVTPGNYYAFTWQEETDSGNVVHVRELNDMAADVFPPVVLTAQYGCTNPRVIAADHEAIIVQYLKPQGTVGVPPQHVYAQKFDHSGNALWATGGVPIMTTNGLAPWMQSDLVSDGMGGAISYWYDTRDNNRHHVYVQRIRSNGSVAFTANGIQTVLAADQLQMSPTIAFVPDFGRVMLFYMTADLNQNNWGIGGQAVDSNGTLLWGNNGISFVAQDARQRFLLQAFPENFGATVVYLENVTSGSMNDYVKGFGVNADGSMAWRDLPRMLCSVASSKLHLDACKNRWGQVIAAWGDGRATGDDIYLQNINPDGTLGPLAPPVTLQITAPPESSSVWENRDSIRFNAENFVLDESGNGDGVISITVNGSWRGYHGHSYPIPLAHILALQWNHVVLELVNNDHQSLNPRVMDSVNVDNLEDAADDLPSAAIHDFALLPAYPNPFNPRTMLRFGLAKDGHATLVVYDVLGREAARPLNGFLTAGYHEIPFEAAGLPGGIYFCRLQAGGKTAVQKMMLVR